MVFSSTLFLFLFLPVTLSVYYVIQEKFKNYWLLLVSILFFAWSQINYLWIIFLNIGINYSGALLIKLFKRQKRLILTLAVAANLGILFYFKYFNFAVSLFIRFTGSGLLSLRDIVLPIGISFFTFQGMSYVIDVYREEVPVQKNIFKVALYIVLFPQLIAGPIVRYKDVAREIDRRKTTLNDFSSGIERLLSGFPKKPFWQIRLLQQRMRSGSWVLPTPPAKSHGLEVLSICCRSISIFPDTAIWPSDLAECLVSTLMRTLICLISLEASLNFGADGIFPFLPGSVTMSIFL